MQPKTLRTIGASVVLAGITVAGIIQVTSGDPDQSVEVATPAPPEADEDFGGVIDVVARPTTTVAPEPFVYKIGVLASVSTENFWSYYGEEPSVWNSYILGPTKPALFTLDPTTGSLSRELSAVDEVKPTWNEDGWRVRIPLDPKFRWSDGTPVTAHDFVFTFETVRSAGLGGSWADSYPSIIESVHADDDHLLRIEFKTRPFLTAWPHGIGLAPVMPRHVWSDVVGNADAKDLYAMSGASDVSGGPLTLVEANESHATSEANSGYPRAGVPDVVEYKVYETEEALIAAVAAGEIDSLLTPKGITPEQQEAIESNQSVSILTSPANGIRYLGFNLEREPMSTPAFRTALALILDREGLSDDIPHTGDVAPSLLPSTNGQWFQVEKASANLDQYAGSPSKRLARALEGLKSAGYAWSQEPTVDADGEFVPGQDLTVGGRPPQPLTILTPGDEYDTARPAYVQRIADTLAIFGFDTRPVETDFDTVVDLAFTRGDDGALHYDMYMLGWTLGSPALPGFYRPLFATDGAMNNTGYSSGKFEKALRRYEHAFTTEEAADALWTMEQTLARDLPYLLLYTSEVTEIYRSDRVRFDVEESLGGLQGRLGGIGDVSRIDD